MRLVELVGFGFTISAVVDEGNGLAPLRATSPVPEHAATLTTTTAPRIEDDFRRRDAGRRSSSVAPRPRGMLVDRHEGTSAEGFTRLR